MAWITPTENDLKTRLSGPELSAFRAAALDAGQDDPVDYVMDQAIDLVRGYVAACPRNVLGLAGTIPQKLLGALLDILVIDVMKRAGGLIVDADGERKKAKDEALRLLERVADGKFAIEEPETEDTETHGAVTPSTSSPTRYFDQDSQSGL